MTGLLALSGCAGEALTTPGAVYKALGTEPFWSLRIEGRTMHFNLAADPENTEIVSLMRNEASTPAAASPLSYTSDRIIVTIAQVRCNDGMSDRTFPDTVRVLVDGRAYDGCGGDPLPPSDLGEGNWRIDAIDGEVTPDAGTFDLRFSDERIAGSAGCNWFSIPYSRDGNRIIPARPIQVTKRLCEDMSFERKALDILSQPMKLVGEAGERVTLSNSAGRIQLRKAP